MLETLVILLGATAIAVHISRRLGFGSILGYLVAGVAIGPDGFRLISDVEQIAHVSELGVVMLLFLIGLELRPQRLWALRKPVFGLGFGQMLPTAAAITVLAHLGGLHWTGAAVLGAGLALSSTAIVLPMLGERGLLSSSAGRDSFAVLLFQDIAFIPLVALVPILADGEIPRSMPWLEVLRGLGVIAAILVGGWLLVPRIFRAVGGAQTPELFTAISLLVVAGAAALAGWGGLSMSLGAFTAGVLLSDSEYRHELQADIEPFQGLLLGFFFTSVGMGVDLDLALDHPLHVALAVLALVTVKVIVNFLLGLSRRRDTQTALRFALALPQGSEFGFVLFGAAVANGALLQSHADFATLTIALSMILSPVLFAASERLLIPRLLPPQQETAYDVIEEEEAPVIICGFGRIGQIVSRVLHMQRIPFVALDKSSEQIEVVRRFGGKVYFGNPVREDVLRAAGAEQAKLLVIALDDTEEALALAEMAGRHFPHLVILARARNRRHAHLLMDRNVTRIVRETFFSSLKLSEMAMEALGIPPDEIERAIRVFREHDERQLRMSHAIYMDEDRLIQSTREAAQELAELLEADRKPATARTVEQSTPA
ncbi:monovalent cation:proton antiporter-2 (CPA2) family protein [Belnapia rosea]|uniref:Kef-type potassium/proton antiporter, CPA2 family n=1 Tax=Belnapia rosea TaxID=938405 RepID=A0A1G6QUG5_9PROT|nr:monovalent cation:proton antiporter-2 (CPA2) family protein [Belnapia rosea]SDC95425.1 Kef-type potassium/proton antiporter, CPA2 family [Belnapia rosea]